MSPKADQKKHPQVKPSWNMEMRRRRADEKPAAGAESHGADGAVSSGAGCSGADGGAEQRPAADGAAGIVEETAIIGQELVPVARVSEKGLSDEQLQVEAVPKSFQTPENQKTMGSPERLQLENKADLKTNEDSEKKGEGEDKGQMAAVPNGPPVSYGPDSAVSMPLFTPDQIAQANDPRNSSSLLPMTRESVMAPEFPRLPGFLHGLLPGYEQLYEVRQRELEWRLQMEMMLEQLGLQLRASQNENLRLRQELQDSKRGSSRYGTPEEVQSLGKRDDHAVFHGLGSFGKEDGVVARQDRGVVVENPQKGKRDKEDGAVARKESQKEDGAVARKERKKEDGTRVQQDFEAPSSCDQSDQSESSAEGSQGKEDGPAGRQNPGASEETSTMQVLLKIVQGMQSMQKQLLDGRDDHKDEAEFVRFSPDLPRLPEWSAETAPIDYGDWITCLHTYMSDLSPTSEQWWDLTIETAKTWYQPHMSMTPIQRLSHHPAVSENLKQKKWGRLERRAASLLMGALPEQLREEVISSKSVTTLGIICKAMLAYQPGGLSERSAILTALESPPECNSVPSATSQLRKWIRWKRRATEVGVAIPDPSILMRGLGRIMKKVVQTFPELSFRLSLVRNGLLVDTVPTHETVSQYSEHLLAELEQMGQQAKRREAPQDAPPKLRKVEENSKLEEPTKNFGKPNEETDGKKKPCGFFLTDAGCKRGKSCQFLHNLDGQRRCWTCGSKAHLAPACPRAEETKPRAAKIGTKNVERDAKATSSTSTSEKPEEPPESTDQTGGGEDTMKVLIDEANKMLKSLHQSDPKERTISPKVNEDKMMQLQRQLDELKKASLRPFRLSRMGCSRINGLLDSGATHPLRARRKGERVSHLPKVQVNLAGDQQVTMHLSPTGVIIGEQNSEPIVPWASWRLL